MIVLFDTNAYRDLSSRKTYDDVVKDINTIIEAEAKKDIKAFMSTTVALELMYHLSDPATWNSYRSCINAAPAMYLHCKENNSFRVLPLPEVQIAKAYFGVDNTKSISTQEAIGQIFYDLSTGDPNKVVQKHKANITKAHDFIVQAEAAIAEEVDKYLTYSDPNYKHDWNPFVNDQSNRTKYLNMIRSEDFLNTSAYCMLAAVAFYLNSVRLNVKMPEGEEQKHMIEIFKQDYSVALYFRQKFCEYAANGGFDVTKDSRANYRWDEYILHCAGHSVNGEPIMIVTTDGNMTTAMEKFNVPHMSLVEYLNYIGVSIQIH